MYKYKLSNNHYIIDIEGRNYLLDTGSPKSFTLKHDLTSVVIDGRRFPLYPKPLGLSVPLTTSLVGMEVDGFIGMDIVRETSLTIYKDGRIDFSVNNEEGTKLDLLKGTVFGGLRVKMSCNGVVNSYFIDTGARYGYGDKYIFDNNKTVKPCGHVYDYNPRIGSFDSDIYRFKVDFGPIQKEIELGDSEPVRDDLHMMKSSIVGNITPLFDEVCVIDTQNDVLTIR